MGLRSKKSPPYQLLSRGPVAQRQSARLITGWSQVRTLAGPLNNALRLKTEGTTNPKMPPREDQLDLDYFSPLDRRTFQHCELNVFDR
jgi:hypothetical protein